MKHYVLLRNRVIAETSFLEWALWMQEAERVIGHDETELHLVSTVFLGLDLRPYGSGPPTCFETMVFAKVGDDFEPLDWACRYTCYDDAEAGHKAAVASAIKMEQDARQGLK